MIFAKFFFSKIGSKRLLLQVKIRKKSPRCMKKCHFEFFSMSCCFVLLYSTLRYVMLCAFCYGMFCYVMLCYVTLYYVMLHAFFL